MYSFLGVEEEKKAHCFWQSDLFVSSSGLPFEHSFAISDVKSNHVNIISTDLLQYLPSKKYEENFQSYSYAEKGFTTSYLCNKRFY